MKAIIPAIDISSGRCVRLTKGNFDTKKVYANDPVELTQQYYEWGAKRVHIVDLDAAFGRGNNRALISEISKVTPKDCVLEVGGGIRSEVDIKSLLGMGVDRLCLGTILVKDIFQVIHWTNKFGRIFIGSVDIKDKEVQVAGWQQESGINAIDFVKQLSTVNLCCLEYTNISHDGTLAGPDLSFCGEIAEMSHIPVVLSGGVGKPEDVDKVISIGHDNIVGVILGKSVLEGIVNLKEILKKYPSPDCSAW